MPKFAFVLLSSLIAFAASTVYSQDAQPSAAPKLAERGLCAHRGDQGAAPENTIPAFVAAAKGGAQMVELDVQKTKDGKLVIMHDLTVDRTTNGKGAIVDLTFDEIRALDAGIKRGEKFAGLQVPTFEEALDCLPRNIWINVHVKPGEGIAEAAVKVVRDKDRLHQAFFACDVAEILAVRAICPNVLICNMERQGGGDAYVQRTIDVKSDFIQLTEYNAKNIADLKAAGIKINYFGTNDPEFCRKLYNDGIDFPLVDRYSEMIPVAREFGIEPNPVENDCRPSRTRVLSRYLPNPFKGLSMNRLVAVLFVACRVASLFAADETPETFYSRESELTPASVWSAGEVFVDPNTGDAERYGFAKMIDGDPDTYACMLDSTRDGSRQETTPAFAAAPITAEFVLDLGSEQTVCGLRITTPRNWRSLSPKSVSVFACEDAKGEVGGRALCENAELLPLNGGYSVCVLWSPTPVRYLLVKSNDCWQLRNRRQGISEEIHFNTQIAEITALTSVPDDVAAKNPNDVAYPESRLRRDWLLQDAPKAEVVADECFASTENATNEAALVDSVLVDLEEYDSYGDFADGVRRLRAQKDALLAEKVPGKDDRWKSLYYAACAERRKMRFELIREYCDKIVYVKHFVFGGTEGLTGIAHVSDAQYWDQTTERRAGSQLCLLTLNHDGTATNEVLLEKPNGVVRDPNLSWDATKLVFSARDSFETDDYSLYEMDLADRSIRRLTAPPEFAGRKYPCADYEPCYDANGDILFASTRHTQINDCWPNDNSDIYRCDADGKHIRRLTYDELDVNFPQTTPDGRVIFTRWEYNDRNAYFLHPLMVMNPDGSGQTEFCGNNSMFPASYLQARPVPDSTKVVAIISGHHVPHKGKLALIDRSLGTQDGDCIEFIAGSSPDGTPGRVPNPVKPEGHNDRAVDMFGQTGPQFQYPFPLDENNFLVAFCPEGWSTIDGPYTPPFGIYFTTADGDRELLAFDWSISCGQPIPLVPRPAPIVKSTGVDPSANYGTYVVQDVYEGPGLAGIERGTVKKLRVVALEYRAAKVGKGSNAGEVDRGLVQTPISFNNGSWDVKHVLGEVDVESDGSVAFKVPARTPVYFQLLDDKGYCVQTMRSWSTLQGGERFACLGCHENKLETGAMQESRLNSIAANKAPQTPRLADGSLYWLYERLEKESCLDSVENYLGVNAPKLDADPDAPTAGFSYRQEVQPILDRHCVECHYGETRIGGKPSNEPDLRGVVASVAHLKQAPDDDHKRAFSRSYLALTNNGKVDGSRWTRWLEVRSRSAMLPPYFTGSSQSPLMKYLEPEHYGVQVSEIEKRTIACWIDLLIPFCGSYFDANRWSSEEKIVYLYYLQKRLLNADLERIDVAREKESNEENARRP